MGKVCQEWIIIWKNVRSRKREAKANIHFLDCDPLALVDPFEPPFEDALLLERLGCPEVRVPLEPPLKEDPLEPAAEDEPEAWLLLAPLEWLPLAEDPEDPEIPEVPDLLLEAAEELPAALEWLPLVEDPEAAELEAPLDKAVEEAPPLAADPALLDLTALEPDW